MTGTAAPQRRRLPNRRPAVTEDIIVGNTTLSASVGFGETGRPAEIFLTGAKDGSGMAAILEDASVVISIALQHGIPARALAKSVSRLPTMPLAPPYLDHPADPRPAASVIGAALDLLTAIDRRPV